VTPAGSAHPTYHALTRAIGENQVGTRGNQGRLEMAAVDGADPRSAKGADAPLNQSREAHPLLRDQAVIEARQLADLVSSADVPVAAPGA